MPTGSLEGNLEHNAVVGVDLRPSIERRGNADRFFQGKGAMILATFALRFPAPFGYTPTTRRARCCGSFPQNAPTNNQDLPRVLLTRNGDREYPQAFFFPRLQKGPPKPRSDRAQNCACHDTTRAVNLTRADIPSSVTKRQAPVKTFFIGSYGRAVPALPSDSKSGVWLRTSHLAV